MGISLSNKDYIAFIYYKEKKERERERKEGKERHDDYYDAIADYNKTIIKKMNREKKRDVRERERIINE